MRMAGLRVTYAKVFEGCRSKKAKAEKLTSLLEDAGLKGELFFSRYLFLGRVPVVREFSHIYSQKAFVSIGNPTLEKCKKLRRKRETMREVAELDCSNILGNTAGDIFVFKANFFSTGGILFYGTKSRISF